MKQIFQFLAVVSLALSSANAGTWHTTDDGSVLYIETEDKFNWFQAQSICSRLKMSLISVESRDKHLQLLDVFKTNFNSYDPHLWIGGHDNAISRAFEWISTGQTFSYTNWNDGEPNSEAERCVMIFSINLLLWNDAPCSTEMGFVCEANPLFKENNVELTLLKASLETQKKLLMDKTEEVGSLKQEIETINKSQDMQEKATNDLNNIKDLCENAVNRLQQKQDEFISIHKSSDEKLALLTEKKEGTDQMFRDIREQLNAMKILAGNQTDQLLNQTDVIVSLKKSQENIQLWLKKSPGDDEETCNPESYAVQSALLKVKSEDLEILKKTNEQLSNQLFTVLMKSYERNINQTMAHKNYHFYQNFAKN